MNSNARRRGPLPRGSKIILSLGALGLFAGGIYLGVELAKPPPRPSFGPSKPAGKPVSPPAVLPAPSPTEEPLDIHLQPPPPSSGRPRIALVIDDLGRSLTDLEALEALDVPLTYAVLPFESRTPEVVAELHRRHAEVLCHLPMEAKGGENPGPGALFLAMSRQEIQAATRRALAAVPGSVGVNNHMGSAVSVDRGAITAVLEVLAQDHLYYIDSRTDAETLGYSVARQLGVPAAERQVFLDPEPGESSVREQFARLLEVARKRGSAIAIAHPHPATLEVLAQEVELARGEGFEFVIARELLDGG